MKSLTPHFLLSVAIAGIFVSSGFAQQTDLGNRKGPTTKIYLAETKGESAIVSNGKTFTAEQAKSFDAQGTMIETKDKSHNAFVYSNGTGLYMEENTRIKIDRFAQERFLPSDPNKTNPEIEPSSSQSNVVLSQGTIGICTNQLAVGTTMVYSTSSAVVIIRRGRVSIESTSDGTIVDLLEGDITVRNGAQDQVGQVLRPGDRAVVRAATAGQPATLTIVPTPKDAMAPLDERSNVACNAKKTVFFDANDAANQEITANPAVPAKLPANITVSPDRL